MISAERIEAAELMPSGAKLGRGLKVEAADVRAHHGDAEQVELIQAVDRGREPLFLAPVIGEPVEGPLLDTR